MSCQHEINPYKSISENDKIFEFGMSQSQVAAVDSKVFEIKEDNTSNWRLERRGGYSTEFIDGKLVAAAFRIDPEYNFYEVEGIDITDTNGIEELKSKHEHCLFSNGKSILFPKLGFLVSVTPFCDGWEAARPNVFNKEIIAFSKERLAHYYNEIHVIKVEPTKEIYISCDKKIQFAMPPEEIRNILGKPEKAWENYGSHKHIVEYYQNHGFKLKYRSYKASYQYKENMPLYSIEILEKNGWKVMMDDVSIFDDDKLAEMKSRYEYIESKKKKAVDFPSIGVFTLGCGEKKNTGKGADGKVVFLYNNQEMKVFTDFIDMWD